MGEAISSFHFINNKADAKAISIPLEKKKLELEFRCEYCNKNISSKYNLEKHIKICIDTAHIWGVGNYNIKNIDEVDRLFSDFQNILGMDFFYVLHLKVANPI